MKTINEFTGKKRKNKGAIKAKCPEEGIKKWKDHFLNLLEQPSATRPKETKAVLKHTLPINTDDFTMEELNKYMKSFKNNKAPGLDNVPIEVWKTGALNMKPLEVNNRTLNGDRAKVKVKSGIMPLPKNGDLRDIRNDRGISLTVIANKIYNKLLLERIRSQLDPLLRINQNGFRPVRSTVAQTVTLRRLIVGVKAKQLQTVTTFVDFKKAFDYIH